jgi:hypothetical protein
MRSATPYSGVFVPRDGSRVGHLSVAGKDSAVTLVGKDVWNRPDAKHVDIQGRLSDGRKASLGQVCF